MNDLKNLQISELALLNDSLEKSHAQTKVHQTHFSNTTRVSLILVVIISLSLLLGINFSIDVYQSYLNIAESNFFLAILYLVVYFITVVSVLVYVFISIKNYINLKVAFEVQEKTLDANSYEKEKKIALSILKHYMHHQDEHIKKKATQIFAQVKSNSIHAPFVEIKEKIINDLDKEATSMVYKSAKEVSIFTAFAPGSALDSLAVIFSSLKLMKKVFYIYGYRTNLFTSLLIIKKILQNASIAALVEYADDSLNDLLGNTLLSKLSTKMAQGVGNGVLMLRVGNILMQSARPFASDGSIGSYKHMLKLFVEYIKSKVGKKS